MESEWEPILMEISAYKETGTFIMKSNEETGQMLDDHIVMTQAMSFSPYKKPFEGRITTWENKLRTTQVPMHNHCMGETLQIDVYQYTPTYLASYCLLDLVCIY